MDYKKHYDLLIEKAKNRTNLNGYKEKHHIIPKCMYGTNDKNNLVILTAREHYLAHWLLLKTHPKHNGLIFALNIMAITKKDKRKLKITSKEYEKIKELQSKITSKLMTGVKKSEEHCKNISKSKIGDKNSMWGKQRTQKDKNKISNSMKGENNYWYGKRGEECSMYGKKHKSDTINKMRKNKTKNKKIIIDNIQYPSISEAGRILSILVSTIWVRLKSKNFPNYTYV